MIKYIGVMGNPIEGLMFVGPFDTMDEATMFMEHIKDITWWITEIAPPFNLVENRVVQ